jgi:hypothetical protein
MFVFERLDEAIRWKDPLRIVKERGGALADAGASSLVLPEE